MSDDTSEEINSRLELSLTALKAGLKPAKFSNSDSSGWICYIENKAEKKGATEEFSFGYARFRLLGALVNSVVFIGRSIYIIYEVITRLQNPEAVESTFMIGIAVIDVLSNG